MANFKIKNKITGWKVLKKENETNEQIILSDVKLPSNAPARMYTLRAEGKKWYLTVVTWQDDENKPFAMFCHTNHREPGVQTTKAVDALIELGKTYKEFDKYLDELLVKIHNDNNVTKLTRVVSLLLRHNVPIIKIVGVLDSIEDIFVGSFLFQIKKHLTKYIQDGTMVSGKVCSNCQSTNLKYESGCVSCIDCGNSNCG